MNRKSTAFIWILFDRQESVFVEDEGKMKAWIEKQTEMFQEVDTPKQLLLRIMEHMIEEDTLYFSHMESELDKLEEKISGGTGSNNNFSHH